jgi:predicted transcriptional regulator of viral defense system
MNQGLSYLINAGRPFTAKEAQDKGVSHALLSFHCQSGRLERLCQGVYAPKDMDISPMPEIEVLLSKGTDFVVCLLSALRLHNFTTQTPHELWVAVRIGRRLPQLSGSPAPVCIQMSDAAYEYGIEHIDRDGLRIPVYSPAKTVADCFKFRNKYGLDVAMEALREGHRLKKFTVDALEDAARICRVSNIMRPYMEMMLL